MVMVAAYNMMGPTLESLPGAVMTRLMHCRAAEIEEMQSVIGSPVMIIHQSNALAGSHKPEQTPTDERSVVIMRTSIQKGVGMIDQQPASMLLG